MTDTQPIAPSTVKVTINGHEIDAPADALLIDAAEEAGVYIPRFCYHPRMEPVGMCRMCIVEVDSGRGPGLQPSCMLTVADGMIVDTEGDVTKKAQDGILEFLLINHPLDCPVCDKGGECPLQDQTMAFGPGESRFVEEKRHFEKPIPISDTVNLDRERCILCDRCTRFAKDVAGDPLIHFQDRGNQTQVNTFPDHPFASYFSGNTVQICPVGALTATPYRFKARPWDLATTESTCQSCAVGCRVTIDSSRNEVVRYNGVDIDPVNWGWLCDKGRFDFEAVNSDERLAGPMVRSEEGLVEASWSDAMRAVATAVKGGVDRSGPEGLAVIGGARLTNEDAYAWAKLVKGVIGSDHVDAQLGDGFPADAVLGLPRATIDDACTPGATVLLIGPDLKEELSVLYLRLRHAVEHDGVRLIEVVPALGPTSAIAHASVTYRPGELVDTVHSLLGSSGDDEAHGPARAALAEADAPVVLLGRANLAESGEHVAAAASAVLETRPEATFLPLLRRANLHGALDMGLSPGLLPGRVALDDGRQWFHEHWATLPAEPGLDTTGILQAAAAGKIDTLVLLGADPIADFPDADLAAQGLAGARTVIALDTFLTDSSRRADIVLPVSGFAECAGTTTNLEGRVSTLHAQVTPPGTSRSDWMIAADLALRLGADLGLDSVEQIWAEIERVSTVHAGITLEVLAGRTFADGVVVPRQTTVAINRATDTRADPENAEQADSESRPDVAADAAVPADGDAAADTDAESTDEVTDNDGDDDPAAPTPIRPPLVTAQVRTVQSPSVDAYGLRLVASRKMYDLGTLVQHSPCIAPLAAETELRIHPHDFDRVGIEPGGSVRITSSKIAGVLAVCRPDAAVHRGSAHLFFNQPGIRANELIDALEPVTDLRIENA